jgi:MoxR-like ATPase
VWATAATQEGLSEAGLTNFLHQVAQSTLTLQSEIPKIVSAIKARLSASPAAQSGTFHTPALEPAVEPGAFATLDQQDEAIQVDSRIWHMILTAIRSSPATILVGPPGTGKSALVRKAVGTLSSMQQDAGGLGLKVPLWATPDESWTARDLIGGETIAEGEIVFRPGWVLRSIAEGRWLILDEANRGDLDRIFGALLTWLSGGSVSVGVESSASDAKRIGLGWTSGTSRVEVVEGEEDGRGEVRYLAGDDWRLVGTYNALDSQRVFRIGAALGRRFVRVPVPPLSPSLFLDALEMREKDLPQSLKASINRLYSAHYFDEVTRLGPALFFGMCGYIKAGIENALPTTQALGDEQGPLEAISSDNLPPGEAMLTASVAVPASNRLIEAIFREALCEAYVLNAGTQLAQLEEPDFEQLRARLLANQGLTEGEMEWVKEMMKALA